MMERICLRALAPLILALAMGSAPALAQKSKTGTDSNTTKTGFLCELDSDAFDSVLEPDWTPTGPGVRANRYVQTFDSELQCTFSKGKMNVHLRCAFPNVPNYPTSQGSQSVKNSPCIVPTGLCGAPDLAASAPATTSQVSVTVDTLGNATGSVQCYYHP